MISVALFDVDGVLTDGSVLVDSHGHEFKRIRFDDIDAIFALKHAGIKIGFITAEKTGFAQYLKKRFLPDILLTGEKDKLAAFRKISSKFKINRKEVCYVGDSMKDALLLQYVGLGCAPKDAPRGALVSASKKLKSRRGEGVICEVAEIILRGRKNSHV